MIQDPERDHPRRRSALLARLIAWPFVVVIALALLIVGFPGERWLDQQWLRLTTAWLWQSDAPAPRYRTDPRGLPESARLVWPGETSDWRLGPLYAPQQTTEVAAAWPERWLVGLLPEVGASAALTPADRYWQPAEQGYKTLIYRTDAGLVTDAQLTLLAEGDWHYRPPGTLAGPNRTLTVDWQGGLRLADFAVPEPVPVDTGGAALPRLAGPEDPGVQALREHWALQQGYSLVTPVWLTPLAALAMSLPWLWPRLLLARLWTGPLLLLGWLAAHFGLAVFLRWWLPLWYPLTAWLAAILWYRQLEGVERQRRSLATEYRDLAVHWLRHLLDEGKTEAGLRFVSASPVLATDPQLTYELGQGFERKRQYDQALDCFDNLATRHPGYRDVEQRLERLKPLADPVQTLALGGATQPIPTQAGVQAPELGRYRILGELGRGAMGVVYEAEDPRINRRVALKVVQLDALELEDAESVKQRFFREAQAAGRLNHPNIVTVHDVGEERDLAYIAMDRLTGQALSRRLNSQPRPSIGQVCDWLAQAADALDFAHRNDIIHRDVKPANLYIDEARGQLTVTDFGVARITGVQQTQTGIVLGSPSFMSPEQIRGEPLTGATDIFSLGVTLYQALSGQLPFSGDTLPALAYAITQVRQESPRKHNPDVPVALVRIVNRALNKDPADRYASAGEMAQALRKWAGAGE